MAITDLGACEWFVWDLRRSNLIDRGQLDQVISEFLKKQPRAEPPDLAKYLVAQNILTEFQAERLLQGKTQGLVLGPYTLMDALGTGSMGTVYKALSKNDNGWYAVKVLPRRSMWNVRIARRQVRTFEQCRHKAVVPFVDVGTSGGTHYLAWPLVDGEPLESLVQREGKLAPEIAALFIKQTAEGLDICHQKGLIHGLLKPSNLMVGSDNQVRILDFGIGTLLAESTEGESLVDTMSTANTLTSGLDCASPESILEPTNRTAAGDQYSLGCVFYFCLTGQYPFPEGSAVEKMMAHQMKEPAPLQDFNPDAPAALQEIVSRMMQKTPEARYGSIHEIIEALEAFAGEPASAPAPQLGTRPVSRSAALSDMAPAKPPASLPKSDAAVAISPPPQMDPEPAAPPAATTSRSGSAAPFRPGFAPKKDIPAPMPDAPEPAPSRLGSSLRAERQEPVRAETAVPTRQDNGRRDMPPTEAPAPQSPPKTTAGPAAKPTVAPTALPTRQSLRGNQATPQPVAKSALAEDQVPDAPQDQPMEEEDEPLTLEERLGPVGTAVALVVVTVAVMMIAMMFFQKE